MKWQPKRTVRDAGRLGVLVERAMVRFLFGPAEFFRALR